MDSSTQACSEFSASEFPCPYEPSDRDSHTNQPSVLRGVLSDLDKRTQEYGCSHTQVGDLWNSLGLIRDKMQHDLPAAVKCHNVALRIYRTSSITTPPVQLAVCLSDLAGCHERLDDTKQAISLYQEALTLLESTVWKHNSFLHLSIKRSLARLERR
jgi:tetratricopeptide (TPR) repeat protein